MDHKAQMLLDMVKKLIRRGAHSNINNLLKKTHPADIANLFSYLSLNEQRVLFTMLEDVDTAAEVLSEIEHGVSAQLLEQIEQDTIVHVLQHMPHDDAVDIIQHMPEALATEVLDSMQDECSDEIEQLMLYQEDSAGGIMSTDYFSLGEELTAKEAIEALQGADHVEMVFYVYVTDIHNHLVGVLSLRQLLTVPPEVPPPI